MSIRNLVNVMNRKEGVIKFSDSETYDHFKTKCDICYWLKKNKVPFYTEAIFTNFGGRADVFADYGNYGICYEIYKTETRESLIKKSHKYPEKVNIVCVKAGTIITDELMG